MAGELEGGDGRSRMRASDADRHRVAEILRNAAGDGRLDMDELEERLESTYAAKTYADLLPLTADLPAHGGTQSPAVRRPAGPARGSAAEHASSVAIMGDCKRQGVWRFPAEHTATAVMGDVTVDLRQAELESDDSTITAVAIMGSVKVIVPADMRVSVDGVPVMGDFSQAKDKVPAQLRDDSPRVRVRGFALMGGVTVVRLPPPGTPRKLLGTY